MRSLAGLAALGVVCSFSACARQPLISQTEDSGKSLDDEMGRDADQRLIRVRVRIVELDRAQAKKMGIDLYSPFDNDRPPIARSAVPSQLSGIGATEQVQTFVDRLAASGLVKSFGQASLATLNGHAATFNGGGEFPSSAPLSFATDKSTHARSHGVELSVTPTITDEGTIRFTAVVELATIPPGHTAESQSRDIRRISTSLEVREGQTAVLGGMISRSGEMEKELVILVTPEIENTGERQ